VCSVGLCKQSNETYSAINSKELLTSPASQLVGPCLLFLGFFPPHSFSTSFTSHKIKDQRPSDVGYNTSVSFGVRLFKQTITPKDTLKDAESVLIPSACYVYYKHFLYTLPTSS
jgi:hypothetical protein